MIIKPNRITLVNKKNKIERRCITFCNKYKKLKILLLKRSFDYVK